MLPEKETIILNQVSEEKDGRSPKKRFHHFTTILGFQIVSEFGSALTSFALSVWAFQTTESYTAYGLIIFAASMSVFAMAPIAGNLVDRWNKKFVLCFTSIGSALISLTIGILYWLGSLEVWHLFFLTLVNGIIIAFTKPAIITAVKILLDPADLQKGNGIMSTGFGMVALLAPISASVIMVNFGLFTVLLIDISSFIVGIIALTFLKLPASTHAPTEAIWDGIKFAWAYLKKKYHFLWLNGFYAILNFFIGITFVLLQPMVLTLTNPEGLGRVMTLGGIGYVVGGIFISSWKGPKLQIFLIYGAGLFMSLSMIFIPISTNIWMLALGAFLVSAAIPVFLTANIVMMQKKVEISVLGRVDGLGTIMTGFFLPLGFLVGGPLAEHIFEPLMLMPNDSIAFIQSIFGSGKGRGAALLISTSSIIMAFIIIVAMFIPNIRRLELDLPDET